MATFGVMHYGLRVSADYTTTVFGNGRATFVGAGKLEDGVLTLAGDGALAVTGHVALEIRGFGNVQLHTERDSFSTIVGFLSPGAALRIVHRGTIEGVVRMERTMTLTEGACYEEMQALSVTGQFDGMTRVVHEGKAKSDIRARVVLDDGAKAIVRGEIVMGAAAVGSEGYERMDALLLGAAAEANLLPMLDVRVDDVRCKHAASTVHPSGEQLFYLQSRGLSAGEAKSIVAAAFLRCYGANW